MKTKDAFVVLGLAVAWFVVTSAIWAVYYLIANW